MTNTVRNKGLIFKKVPEGWPTPGEDIAVEDRPIDLDQELPEGSILVRNYYASFDPYQRGRMRAPEVQSYSPPFDLGQPITNRTILKVLRSSNPKFTANQTLISTIPSPIEEYSVLSSPRILDGLIELNNPHGLDPIFFLGPLGMPGLTAYSSLLDIGQPKAGETIFVSAASGAVGQLVGQLALRLGLRVIGSVGSEEKLRYITDELGFTGGFNYKNKEESVEGALKRLAPDGVDIYYDNVGGEQLEVALAQMNTFGRVVACGMISQYNLKADERFGIQGLMAVVAKRLTIRGFIVGDENMGPRYAKEHREKVEAWLKEGSLKAKMSVTDGMDNSIDGFLGMLKGENFGKAVLKIAEDGLEAEKK